MAKTAATKVKVPTKRADVDRFVEVKRLMNELEAEEKRLRPTVIEYLKLSDHPNVSMQEAEVSKLDEALCIKVAKKLQKSGDLTENEYENLWVTVFSTKVFHDYLKSNLIDASVLPKGVLTYTTQYRLSVK